MRQPRVFTISPSLPFLPTLAQALLDGRLVPGFPASEAPDALASATIYLPTQRAARAFAAYLSTARGGDAVLLPRIVPLGEADDAELEVAAGLLDVEDPEGLLSPPIAPLERRLLLAGLIQKFARQIERMREEGSPTSGFAIPSSPADAVALAADLEALMDDFTFEDVPVERLVELVDAEFSHYFEFTLEFLRIATTAWPDILQERGASDPAVRRSGLIDAQARLLARETPAGPVIAAGSTGSIPSTARLLAAIANTENGALVLPGLDKGLDEESWAAIEAIAREGERDAAYEPAYGHPQAMLARLLREGLKIEREAVIDLAEPDARGLARETLFSEALRPAETTDSWARIAIEERDRLARMGRDGVSIVEAADEREEALVIALALREVLEEPDKTAALITPDRTLAARVCAEIGRWDVRVEDSAGTPLGQSLAGRLARLACDAALERFAPLELLALVSHPDVRLGLSADEITRATAALEIGLLRGPRAGDGFDALDAALAMRRESSEKEAYRTPLPRQRLGPQDWDLAADLLARLRDAFAGFGPEGADPEGSLTALAASHRRVVEALLAENEGEVEGEERSSVDDGSYEELFALFDEFALQGEGALKGRFRDYPSFFGALAQQRVVKPNAQSVHRRIKVLGPLEARLLHIDRVVLGGLDEGVWPPKTQTDAFLNRPMRAGIGLLPPERRIGQTAHDFVQAAGAREVVVTRARKRNGAPTVASRFLQRLKAFVGEEHWKAMLNEGERLRFLARRVDVDAERPPLRRPNPKPDPALFPRSLSVTEIETLVRDPYSIFAKHVLKLHALEAVGGVPSAAERGTIVHEVFAKFVEAFPIDLPDIAVAKARIGELLGRELHPYIESFPDIYADWLPRLQRLTNAFVEWEYERRAMLATILVERSGKLAIPMGSEYFTLRARADRIERKRDGGVVAVDFKTGQLPSLKEIGVGFSPQLTLEAAMLMRGAFPDAGTVEETPELLYLRTSGGKEPIEPCIVKPPKGDLRSMDEIVEQHYEQLTNLVAQFIAGDIGYMSRPSAKYAKKYNDYDHLARVKEWSATGGTGGDDT